MFKKMSIGKHEIDFILEKRNNKNVVKGIFRTVLSPFTIRKIIEKLPINERAIIMDKNRLVFNVNINGGKEKATRTVKKGDIAYSPLGDEMIIYMEDIEETYNRVNVIGSLINIDDVEEVLKNILMSVKITVKESK